MTVVVFVGGPADGREMSWGQPLPTVMYVPRPPVRTLGFSAEPGKLPPSLHGTAYRYCFRDCIGVVASYVVEANQ